ncbi:hypothetical protein [Mesorhizobium sp.]|uniref:hypothetical protein n=1 Tax=Mesorhizobium sp. TaxID=1871066 RepID=UPI000FE9B02C|nr:hypothetical protein [Mesorhizobium sp.]RWP06709.1 MAG: hypothetical protein EOQ99_09395 [Mesorhizobium sp.]
MANEVAAAFNDAWRDYVTDGVPSSGANKPLKSEIRGIGPIVDAQFVLVREEIAIVEADTVAAVEVITDALSERVDDVEALALAGVVPAKQSVRILMTTNVDIATALENGDTLDALTLATGDRVALTGQTAPAQNGVYVVAAAGAASRSTDMDTDSELIGSRFDVDAGTHAAETWALQTTAPIVVGTTALTLVKTSSANATTAEVQAARGGEATLGDRLDLLSNNEEYGVSIYKSDGITVGGYYAERSANAATTLGKLFAEIIAGDVGAEIEFYVSVDGAVTYGPETVVFGTPLSLTGLSTDVPEGDQVSFVVLYMSGNVTDFFAKIYGAVA